MVADRLGDVDAFRVTRMVIDGVRILADIHIRTTLNELHCLHLVLFVDLVNDRPENLLSVAWV